MTYENLPVASQRFSGPAWLSAIADDRQSVPSLRTWCVHTYVRNNQTHTTYVDIVHKTPHKDARRKTQPQDAAARRSRKTQPQNATANAGRADRRLKKRFGSARSAGGPATLDLLLGSWFMVSRPRTHSLTHSLITLNSEL